MDSTVLFADDEVHFVGGYIVAFGYVLQTSEPYPIPCEDCEGLEQRKTTPVFRVYRSTDGSKAVVTSEIYSRQFDAWLYDFDDRLPPIRIASRRHGQFLSQVQWVNENQIEMGFSSMGSSASLVIDITNSPIQSAVIKDPNFIDIDRNIYVSLDHYSEKNSHWLVVGTIFPEPLESHRFPINIHDDHDLDGHARLKSVKIEEEKLIYSYTEDSPEREIIFARLDLKVLDRARLDQENR